MSPRARASQDMILGVTLDLIAQYGVERVTVDTVALTTGTSKATLYRHWPSRAKLIHAALERLQRPSIEPDTGFLRDDLIGLLRQLTSYLNRKDSSRIFSSLIDAAARDPELAELHKQNEREGRALFERAVSRAIDRGELPPDVDVRLFVDLVISPFIYRRVVVQTPARKADIEPIVDHVVAAFSRVPS
jgi:AcrR family transcriptional regulator